MKWAEERLLYKIAKLYYVDNYTQAEISKELDIYRTTIGRKLKKARNVGIVKIEVQSGTDGLFVLEDEIAKTFGMKEVIIVPSSKGESKQDISKSIGSACNSLLNRIVKDQDMVGLAWGETLGEMAQNITDVQPKKATFFPLVGGPGGMNTDHHVNAITLRLAEAFQGQSHFINAAAVYESTETAKKIQSSAFMKEIIDLWKNLTIAIVGVGAEVSSSNMIWSGFLGEEDQIELMKHNAIGDICSRFYTKEGTLIDSDISERTIAIQLDALKKLRYSIGIAYSKEKADSISAAMKSGFINTLVTNEETASEIYRKIKNK